MSAEELDSKPQPTLRSVIAVARDTANQSNIVVGTFRQFIDAGLLGVCVYFFATFAGFTKADSFIVFAEIAFACAIPLLIAGFIGASYRPRSPEPSLQTVSMAIAIHSSKLPEAVGWLAVAAGVVAFVWHINAWAAFALILASLAAKGLWWLRGRMLAGALTKEELAEIRENTGSDAN